MFLSPLDPIAFPGKRAWDNSILFHEGKYYAFFSTGTPSRDNPDGRPIALDIAESEDGVRWSFIEREVLPIPGAHAGYGVIRIGDWFYYYPTCSRKEKGVHFKIYRSRDLHAWEHLGDERDVAPDRRHYHERWEEMHILREQEDGRDVYYGYVSSEVREDVGAPSAGLVKSYDGIDWEVLPPPVIDWGELPSQHMELNFCEKFGERYYLCLCGRFYLDSHGFSQYVFVGDSPLGPFKPDVERFRLTGTSRRSMTWLGHPFHSPDGMLMPLWLSTGQEHDLPSDNFAIGPLKRLVEENGHLRLRYWEQNDKAKGAGIALHLKDTVLAHPAEPVRTDRDRLEAADGTVGLSGSRDGAVALLGAEFDRRKGFMLEGFLTLREARAHTATHQQPAAAGFYLEKGDGEGRAILAETLGVTRTGTLRFAAERICNKDPYALTGQGLVAGRAGKPQGTSLFEAEDTVGPFGHAAYAGVRHGQRHHFRLIARGIYFEFYIDGYYVQTYTLPDPFTGRIGLAVFDGHCRFEALQAWALDLA